MLCIFYYAACTDRHGFKRLCKLWSHYCKDEAFKYVQKNVIDEYRETCPMTCGKCRIGQKMLDLSVYSECKLLAKFWLNNRSEGKLVICFSF